MKPFLSLSVLFWLLAAAANPFWAGWAFFTDGKIDSPRGLALVLAVQALLGGAGLFWLRRSVPEGARAAAARATWIVFTAAFFFAAGGLEVLLSDRFSSAAEIRPAGCLVAVLALCVAVSTALCLRLGKKKAFFTGAASVLFGCTALILADVLVSFFVPPWPARVLHGLKPRDVPRVWGYRTFEQYNTDFNSWGQRDRERSVVPGSGAYRIVLIGDSFLEQGARRSLSVALERQVHDKGIEFVNLGVSATGPDDYYYRLKEVALRLQPKECWVFLFCGNDFSLSDPTLPNSFLGIVSVAPRGSFLQALRLPHLNFLLAPRSRRFDEIFGARSLFASEKRFFDRLRSAPDEEMPELLSAVRPAQERPHLLERLRARDLSPLYQALRSPRPQMLRSDLLNRILASWGMGHERVRSEDVERAIAYLAGMRETCRRAGVSLKIVLIPDPLVDKRVQRLWKPLSNGVDVFSGQRNACRQVKSWCRGSAGCSVVDLEPVLAGRYGMYGTFDPHWSDRGIDTVAHFLASGVARKERR